MRRYDVRAPDGELVSFSGPDNATEKQILDQARVFYTSQKPGAYTLAQPGERGGFVAPRPKVQNMHVPTPAEARAARDRDIGQRAAALIPSPLRLAADSAIPFADELGGVGAGLASAASDVPDWLTANPARSNPITVGVEYAHAIDRLNKADQESKPVSSLAASLAGASIGALTGKTEAVGLKKGADIGWGIVRGAAKGGLEGLGEGQGLERFGNAAKGALVGAALESAKQLAPLVRSAGAFDPPAKDRDRLVLAGLLKGAAPAARAAGTAVGKAAELGVAKGKALLGAWGEEIAKQQLTRALSPGQP